MLDSIREGYPNSDLDGLLNIQGNIVDWMAAALCSYELTGSLEEWEQVIGYYANTYQADGGLRGHYPAPETVADMMQLLLAGLIGHGKDAYTWKHHVLPLFP